MKTWWLILALLLSLCLVVGMVLLRPEPAGGHGATHPRFESMQDSGGAARHDGLVWVGWLYGSLQLALFVTILTLGLRPGSRFRPAILTGGVCLLAMFSLMMIVYRQSMHAATSGLFLGFPPSTALMLFGLWPLPILFVVIYFVMFDRWIVAPEDLQRLSLLDGRQADDETKSSNP